MVPERPDLSPTDQNQVPDHRDAVPWGGRAPQLVGTERGSPPSLGAVGIQGHARHQVVLAAGDKLREGVGSHRAGLPRLHGQQKVDP